MQQSSIALKTTLDAELYQRTAPALLAYLLRQVNSREDAEDLLLEVFLAALENKRFKDIALEKQLTWLKTVAHNKVVDHYRRTGRRAHVPLVQMEESIFEREELEPEQVALKREEFAKLHQTMRNLSKTQQEVLQLRFGHNLNCQEIAAVMEKSEGAVRMLLSRTLKLLRNLYARS